MPSTSSGGGPIPESSANAAFVTVDKCAAFSPLRPESLPTNPMFSTTDTFTESMLSEADAAVLDALVDVGFDPERTPEPCRPHARRVAELLGGLRNATAADRDTMADVIMLQIARDTRRLEAVAAARHALTPQDDNALDAMVMNAWDANRVPRALRSRANALESLLGTIPGSILKASPDLGDRVFRAIEQHDEEMADRMRMPTRLDPPLESSRRFGFRMGDVGAIAAMLLVAYGLLGPTLNAGRQMANQAACSATMGGIGQALASYAQSNAASLPLAAPRFDRTWWGVGQGPAQSNSANLFLLHRTKHSTVEQLACGGNPHAAYDESEVLEQDWRSLEQVSFSYRLPVQMNGQLRLRSAEDSGFDPSSHPVIADRSPVVLAAVAERPIDPFAPSPNHDARGIGVLMADGSVVRLDRPVLENGDNIWLPRPIEVAIRRVAARVGRPIAGNELPADAADTFLGP